MDSAKSAGGERRYFVGIGVEKYADESLNLNCAVSDVAAIREWFTQRSGLNHEAVIDELAANPTAAQIMQRLRDFLDQCTEDDVIVLYMACHGELDGARAHLFGSDTPRQRLAGRSVEAGTLGAIIGQSLPHNVLLIIDACVAGELGSAIQTAAEAASRDLNNRDPHRRYAQAVISSSFGRDPAFDGRFAQAFLRVVSEERWTGSTAAWVSIDQLLDGLNEELRDIAPTQVAERRIWGPSSATLIPNPNFAKRRPCGLISDEEFAAHFDPSARGVVRGEAGSFFRGRKEELNRIVRWLEKQGENVLPDKEGGMDASMLVLTGSAGSGKSALLSRAVVLSDPQRRLEGSRLGELPAGTLPPADAFDGVLWCRNKTSRDVIDHLAKILGGTAASPEALVQLAQGRSATIAIDALDEAAADHAGKIARLVLRPLAKNPGIRLLVATRQAPVRGKAGGESLIGHLGAAPEAILNLDDAAQRHEDMRDCVTARLRAADQPPNPQLVGQIVEAAGNSFLVASLAARFAPTEPPQGDKTFWLPTEVGAALALYIDRLPAPMRARDLLRPLSWAQGAGLPWGALWPRLATALSRVAEPEMAASYDDGDIRGLLDTAGDLVVESLEAGQPVYRLFHEALAEHLRAETEEKASHDALATAMLEFVGNRPWRQVNPYVQTYVPFHLLGAERLDELVELLCDPTWERERRRVSRDPVAAVAQAEAAIDHLLKIYPADLRVVPLCVVYSRAMTSAPPLLIDVFARSGQLERAEAMANNLGYAVDRILAFRLLAAAYRRERDPSSAGRCVEEVARAIAAVPAVHLPMAYFSLTQAAVDAELLERAKKAAQDALAAALAIAGDGWDSPNGLFWAAMACRKVNDELSLGRIRAELDSLVDRRIDLGRNQLLQAASIAGHQQLLTRQFELFRNGAAYPGGHMRPGNLALALADAGMEEMADAVFESNSFEGEPDSIKRWAWALALRGRMQQAISALAHIFETTEQSKAIARIAAVAEVRGDHGTFDALVPRIEQLIPNVPSRARARLIRVLWLAGRHEAALARAEDEVGTAHGTEIMIDPRDAEVEAEDGRPTTESDGQGKKSGPRQMVTSVVPAADQQMSCEVEESAKRGDFSGAVEQLDGIGIPLFRARSLVALARHHPDPAERLSYWLRALASARSAGRGVVSEVLPLGLEILRQYGREAEASQLEQRLERLEERWQLENFAEQYAALRRTLPPGTVRTRRMTSSMLVAGQLARSRAWSAEELRAAWTSGDDGKRLFALALIRAKPELAEVDILVEGIRGSRSAFEQFHALQAALASKLEGADAIAVAAAVRDELEGKPRPDGTVAGIQGDSSRRRLAEQFLLKVIA